MLSKFLKLFAIHARLSRMLYVKCYLLTIRCIICYKPLWSYSYTNVRTTIGVSCHGG